MNTQVTKIIELEVAEHFSKKTGEVVFVPVGYFPSFDGVTQSKQFCYEVKLDSLATDEHNLCFEYSYKGKASGLANTLATTWVHVVPLSKERLVCYEFDVEKLRIFLKNFRICEGGDFKYCEMKLLPVLVAEKLIRNKFFITIDWKKYEPYWSN